MPDAELDRRRSGRTETEAGGEGGVPTMPACLAGDGRALAATLSFVFQGGSEFNCGQERRKVRQLSLLVP